MSAHAVPIAVFARAPVPGRTKTRLIPALGPEGAARLHERLLRKTVDSACAAGLGPVTLWCAPDTAHPLFAELAAGNRIALTVQAGPDLGARMHQAFATAGGPLLLIGTDCPALTPTLLRQAAAALQTASAVFAPAEDGGYVLVGLHGPEKRLFENVDWGTHAVMEQTRARLHEARLRWRELPPTWDVDRPDDLPRLKALHPDWIPS
jgi:rSAM/selenodomain-associated transferase 1